MRNVTITLDEETAAWARVSATRDDKSLSRFLGDLLQTRMTEAHAWDDVQALLAWSPQPLDAEVMAQARLIERRFHTSWWDALIVAAAQIRR